MGRYLKGHVTNVNESTYGELSSLVQDADIQTSPANVATTKLIILNLWLCWQDVESAAAIVPWQQHLPSKNTKSFVDCMLSIVKIPFQNIYNREFHAQWWQEQNKDTLFAWVILMSLVKGLLGYQEGV
jgi:hypothetical protein